MRTADRIAGTRFHANGTAKFLRTATYCENCHSGHSAVFGGGVMAEARTLRLQRFRSEIPTN